MENTLNRGTNGNASGTHYLLVAVSVVVLSVLAATLIARLTGFTASDATTAAVLDTRHLGFRDLPGGIVEVYDWDSETTLQRIGSGEGAFLRGVVRSLVRQRRGLPDKIVTPFVLTRHSDGRVILSDPATGETIDLVAFGPTNVADFTIFLPAQASRNPNASGTPW